MKHKEMKFAAECDDKSIKELITTCDDIILKECKNTKQFWRGMAYLRIAHEKLGEKTACAAACLREGIYTPEHFATFFADIEEAPAEKTSDRDDIVELATLSEGDIYEHRGIKWVVTGQQGGNTLCRISDISEQVYGARITDIDGSLCDLNLFIDKHDNPGVVMDSSTLVKPC